MIPDVCRELEDGLSDPRWSAAKDTRMAWLAGLKGVEDCIADGLRRHLEAEGWGMFDRYLLAAYHHPSAAQTTVLCKALRLRSDVLNSEDVVDVLAEIRDPAAIDCLRAAVSWEPPWDEFRQLATKAIHALGAIGTPAALDAIRDASADRSREVREAAERELARREG